MKKLIVLLVVSLGMQQALAQPATFNESTLTIPQAVLLDAENPVYYRDVRLSDNGDGTLSVVSGEQQNLVYVESVEVLIMESLPLQVSLSVAAISRYPAWNCYPLQSPAKATHSW